MIARCSEAVKLAGFKSNVQVARLAEVSARTLLYDFNARFSPRKKPKFYAHLRKAMDAKHHLERLAMEKAIIEISNKELK